MPYNITRLTNSTRVQSTNYFLDANVWVYALQYLQVPAANSWFQMYANFFDEIINSPNSPKILMPAVLVSEIINTYLKQVSFEDYKRQIGNPGAKYKQDYRPTQQFKTSYEQIIDDLMSYKNNIRYINDSGIMTSASVFLSKNYMEIDFNDKFYIHLLKEFEKTESFIFVTNDGDFQVENFPILTNNRTLLTL